MQPMRPMLVEPAIGGSAGYVQDAGFGMGLQSEQKSGSAYAYSKLFDTAVLVIPSNFSEILGSQSF